MALIYRLSGFNDYYFLNKVLFRKSYKTKSKTSLWQYRSERKIKQIINNGVKGFILIKSGKRKFYSLQSLKHKLKKCTN
jgi:hypothetical protein